MIIHQNVKMMIHQRDIHHLILLILDICLTTVRVYNGTGHRRNSQLKLIKEILKTWPLFKNEHPDSFKSWGGVYQTKQPKDKQIVKTKQHTNWPGLGRLQDRGNWLWLLLNTMITIITTLIITVIDWLHHEYNVYHANVNDIFHHYSQMMMMMMWWWYMYKGMIMKMIIQTWY